MVPLVTVIVPCGTQGEHLRELHARLRLELARLEVTAEMLFVIDGGSPATRETLRGLAAMDLDCRVIVFRRPYGWATALAAGLEAAQGEYLLVFDPEAPGDVDALQRLLEALQQTDVVVGRREGYAPRGLEHLTFKLARRLGRVKLYDLHYPVKGYRRQVIRELPLHGDLPIFLPVLAGARGFRVSEVSLPQPPGTHHPPYGWDEYFQDLLDLCTVGYLAHHRERPMRLFGKLGAGCLLAGVVLGALLSLYLTIPYMFPAPHWHFFMWLISLTLVILGPTFIAIGAVAEAQAAAGPLPAPPVTERINCGEAEESRV